MSLAQLPLLSVADPVQEDDLTPAPAPAADDPLALYDFQRELLGRVRSRARPGLNLMVQLPTGGGKGEIIVEHADERNEFGAPIVLVHRRNLVQQMTERFHQYGRSAVVGSGPGSKWAPGQPAPDDTTVLCVQTYLRRMRQPNYRSWNRRPLLVDECHWYGGRSGFTEAVRQHEGPVVGFTATPRRTDPMEGFGPPDVCIPAHDPSEPCKPTCRSAGPWHELLTGPQTSDLIDGRYLSDYRLLDLPSLFPDYESVEVQRFSQRSRRVATNDTVDIASTWKRAVSTGRRGAITEDAVRVWRDYAKADDRQTLVFAMSVDHARLLADCFNAAGYSAAVIHAGVPHGQRMQMLRDFGNSLIQVLVSVNILLEGYDAPNASCALILRPTESLALYRQMIGRILRYLAGKQALIIDFMSNHLSPKIGLPDDLVEWQLEPMGEKLRDEAVGATPHRVCSSQVSLDHDGYVRMGETVGGGSVMGIPCHAVSGPAAQRCRGCGSAFGRRCHPDDNGCGLFRSWDAWRGIHRGLRAGACDACGAETARLRVAELSARRSAPRGRPDQARKRATRVVRDNETPRETFKRPPGPDWKKLWRAAKSGNGESLVVLSGTFWVGQRSGKIGCAYLPRKGQGTWDEWFNSRLRDADPDPDDCKRSVEEALNEFWMAFPVDARRAIGQLCGICHSGFYNAQYGSACVACRTSGADPGTVEDMSSRPENADPAQPSLF